MKTSKIFVSHERIYQYVYKDKRSGGALWKHLRHPKKYRKRAGGRDRRGKTPNRRSIEERPAVVDERSRIGDWEADLILGKNHQGVAVTLTECNSRFTLLRTLPSKHAEPITQAIIELLQWDVRLERPSLSTMGKSLPGTKKLLWL